MRLRIISLTSCVASLVSDDSSEDEGSARKRRKLDVRWLPIVAFCERFFSRYKCDILFQEELCDGPVAKGSKEQGHMFFFAFASNMIFYHLQLLCYLSNLVC